MRSNDRKKITELFFKDGLAWYMLAFKLKMNSSYSPQSTSAWGRPRKARVKENLSNRQIFGQYTLSSPLQEKRNGLRLEYIKRWTFEDSLSGKRKIWRLRTKKSGEAACE